MDGNIALVETSINIRNKNEINPSASKSQEKDQANIPRHEDSISHSGSLGQSQISFSISKLHTFQKSQVLNILLQTVQNSEILEVRGILAYLEREEQKPSLIPLRDQRMYSLLHIAAYNNQPSIIEMLFRYEKVISSTEALKNWTNQKNTDTFTALHFTAYRGSIKGLQLLLEQGANIQDKNNQGQNMMSIAAQGDQAQAMVWLRLQGMQFLEKDAKGGTALHWASYYGSELAVNLILSWLRQSKETSSAINLQDSDGNSPLHLATLSSNIKIVKKLLLRGANKQIKNLEGQTPAAIAKENQFEHILKVLLDINVFLEFFNVKTNFKQQRKSYLQMIIFFLLYNGFILLTILFCYPLGNNCGWIIVSIILFILGIIMYYITFFLGPGNVPKLKSNEELLKLYQQHEAWEVCTDCIVYKPKRSRHCEVCNSCIIVYDHHCPWINNCIGARNHGIFYIFLLLLWINMLHILILNCFYAGQFNYGSKYFFWFNNFNGTQALKITKITVQSIIIITVCFFFFPLNVLIYVQTKNFMTNKTTIERYKTNLTSRQKKTGSSLVQSQMSFQEPEGNCCINFYQMCCGNKSNPQFKFKQ